MKVFHGYQQGLPIPVLSSKFWYIRIGKSLIHQKQATLGDRLFLADYQNKETVETLLAEWDHKDNRALVFFDSINRSYVKRELVDTWNSSFERTDTVFMRRNIVCNEGKFFLSERTAVAVLEPDETVKLNTAEVTHDGKMERFKDQFLSGLVPNWVQETTIKYDGKFVTIEVNSVG